ncbi:group 3 secretory phospholipase A2-like [Solea senegalensis]|uniref:phospholipase A2 n=1 Tax=Solea senegalensis TaxID=28829 RepID=A0AAV6R1G0_SOLSE|nr:group 3 secretory phospholipase A2 [Solea senegalensis]KAG7498304.1 group 3 secretory phospholipase A2-like [Solea senegalensis]
MTHIAPLLLFVTSSSSVTWPRAEASILCAWTTVLSSGDVHHSFLRRDSASLRLYHSVHRPGARALLHCATSDDASVIHSYLSKCHENRRDFTDHLDRDFHLSSVFEAEEQCVSLGSEEDLEWHSGKRLARSAGDVHADGRSEIRGRLRVRRGFIVPGTLWCGSGNKSLSYADLGVFADTDSCCREHDQCKHTILSFHSQFGVFNSNIFTMSHCDCDNKFRRCLRKADHRISDVVGYTFFNLLKMRCFEFSYRPQCTRRNWFGMCKETKLTLYAEVHPPTLYKSTSPPEAFVNITSSTAAESEPQLLLMTAAALTVPTPLTSLPSTSITPGNSVTGTSTGSLPQSRDDDQTVTEVDTAGLHLSCDIYEDLDECNDKILPKQMRYGLHNPESRTLYHCNCTARLFQTLVKQRRLTKVHTLLLGHVSQSCFLPQDCTADETCTAALVTADFPLLDLKSGAGLEEQEQSQEQSQEQNHPWVVNLKVRRPYSGRTKGKDRSAKLHKLCVRLTHPKHRNNTRKHGHSAQ